MKKNQENNEQKFYEQDWIMWVTLFLCAPIGIFLMWKYHSEINKNKKITLSIISVFIFIILLGSMSTPSEEANNNTNTGNNTTDVSQKKTPIKVIDFSVMSQDDIKSWCDSNEITCKIDSEYSDTIATGGFISQSISVDETVYENDTISITFSLGKKPSIEYKNALKKAESYSRTMHMSKKGIYDQLTSEYGENFPADAAQYAIDNINADWNANALAKAKSYQETMSMSKNSIYEQLTSEYGEQFTSEEAQYAIDHLDD